MARSRRSKDAPSDFFPGFTDVDEIGSGSIATVYRAQAHGTGRNVALKLISLPDADPTLIAAAERELAALGPLSSHPNIVTLFRNFRLDDGRAVLVLELCQGSLRDRLRDGLGMPVADVVAAGVTIARALDTAHRAGLLHRDVTPGNILVTTGGEPALGDFGLAGLRSPGGPSLDGAMHSAPELLEQRRATPAADVYGLASTLYQLIAGRPAFGVQPGETLPAVVQRVLREPVPPLRAAPPQVAELLVRVMAKDPAARPATAAAFADALAAAMSAPPGGPASRSFTSVPTAMPPQPPPAAQSAESDWSAATLSQPEAPEPSPPVPGPPAAEQTVRRAMLPPEFWTSGSGNEPEPEPRQEPSAPGDLEAAALAEMEAAARADMQSAAPPANPQPPPPPSPTPPPAEATVRRSSLRRLPEPPPPAEATVRRSSLGRLPEPPPPAEATVARSSLHQPLPQPPGPEQTVRRSQPPQFPPSQSQSQSQSQSTVLRSSLPHAQSGYPQPPRQSPAAGPVVLDPAALARKITLRSGRASMTVDDAGLRLRAFLRKNAIAWNDISGFDTRYDDPANPTTGGRLVAITRTGPVELPATRRAMADLRYTHALLEAYRLRAQAASGY